MVRLRIIYVRLHIIYLYLPIYLYLLRFFFPSENWWQVWKIPQLTIHCNKCCGKGGIFFFCPQNKAMLMFIHRCLCLREFYSRKDHCYNGWPSTEFKFFLSWTQVCDLQLGFEQSPLSVGSWGFSGAGQPHLGAHVWPNETGWFLCHSSPCWEHQGGLIVALPCKTQNLALTSPDHSYPGASHCWGSHQLQRKVPTPHLQALVKHHKMVLVLEENGKPEERTQLNPNCLEYFSKDFHFQASLEPCLSWWRSESWKIPSNGKYFSDRTLQNTCQMACQNSRGRNLPLPFSQYLWDLWILSSEFTLLGQPSTYLSAQPLSHGKEMQTDSVSWVAGWCVWLLVCCWCFTSTEITA